MSSDNYKRKGDVYVKTEEGWMPEYQYYNIHSREELSRILDDIESHAEHEIDALKAFISDQHITIDGHFGFKYFLFTEKKAIKLDVHTESMDYHLKLGNRYKKGIVNIEGLVTIQPRYDSIELFWNNLVKVKIKDSGDINHKYKYGILSLDGDTICPPEYVEIFEVSEDLFAVSNGFNIGFMNLQGDVVIPFDIETSGPSSGSSDSFIPIFSNGLACVPKFNEHNKCKFGYINHFGETIFPFIFDKYIEYQSGGIENTAKLVAPPNVNAVYDYHGVSTDYDDDMPLDFDENKYADAPSHSPLDDDILDAYDGEESSRWNTD